MTGRVLVLLSLCLALVVGAVAPVASAQAPPAAGTLRVRVVAPDGVAANVVVADLVRPFSRLVAKAPAGSAAVVDVPVPAGAYRVLAPRVIDDGIGYDGRTLLPVVGVASGRVTDVTVTYAPDGAARQLRATPVGTSGIDLAWSGPARATYVVRRADGPVPPAFLWQGVSVPVQGTRAGDRGLRPGTRYSYSVFTVGLVGLRGPLTTVVGTTPPAGSTDATYVAAPTTALPAAADVVSAAPTGQGVRARLADRLPAPLVGSAVVLPISATLPGGYLGVVRSVAPDGHTVELAAGGLGDAFEYYEIDVKQFTADPPPESEGPTTLAVPPDPYGPSGAAPTPSARRAPTSPRGPSGDRGDRPTPGAQPSGSEVTPGGGRVAPALHHGSAVAATPALAAALPKGCKAGAGSSVGFSSDLRLGGHFTTRVDRRWGVPVGASMDMAVTATVTGAATIDASASFSCAVPLTPVMRPLTLSPVPIAVLFTPTATFGASGKVKATSVGLTATGGVQVSGAVSAKDGASFTGSPIMSAAPTPPAVEGSAGATAKVGGELVLGPGSGTPQAGVIAGLGGSLAPLDASFTLGLCSELKASFTRSLALQAKAFLGGRTAFDKKIDIPALGGSTAYPGFPKRFPTGCSGGSSGAPDSLLGGGVTKVGDSTVGESDQWGHVDGFAPGKKTWVLSTGSIKDALGTPDDFASTDLGRAGEDGLTALAGRPTYDAAAYQVTVVPTGSRLHVKYAFASEEYPEFVGSRYNDVMAVRVGGTNCGNVPGTNQPVSVNTVNAATNSGYFVDNTGGASGYSTSMDGLTVPLTCTVPVTPGVPVSVQLAVADSSDHVLDSAVALLDGGIWTD